MKQYLLSRTDETFYITINNIKYQLVLFRNYPVKDFNYDQDLVKIFGAFSWYINLETMDIVL